MLSYNLRHITLPAYSLLSISWSQSSVQNWPFANPQQELCLESFLSWGIQRLTSSIPRINKVNGHGRDSINVKLNRNCMIYFFLILSLLFSILCYCCSLAKPEFPPPTPNFKLSVLQDNQNRKIQKFSFKITGPFILSPIFSLLKLSLQYKNHTICELGKVPQFLRACNMGIILIMLFKKLP